MAPFQWYRQNPFMAYATGTGGSAPNMDWVSDDVRHALVVAAYTPNLDTDAFWSSVVANEASGTGYTANGFAVASKTLTQTAAASATAWAATTAYGGDTTPHFVRPVASNGYVYRASVAGTSAGAEPTWPTTVGLTVVDSGVTWTNVGRALTAFDMADESRSGLTITYRYSVFYNRTPASDATRPLIALIDWGSTQTITAGTVTVTVNAQGMLVFAVQ